MQVDFGYRQLVITTFLLAVVLTDFFADFSRITSVNLRDTHAVRGRWNRSAIRYLWIVRDSIHANVATCWEKILVMRASLFCVLCLAHLVRADNDTIKSVYFSLILSQGEYGYRSWDAIPAIDIALETIKNQQLLPGYNLTYEVPRNSKVSLN